jgi:hypothetical protein
MTIRFPSRLAGEPLETHEHGVTTFAAGWLPMSKTMRIGMFHR